MCQTRYLVEASGHGSGFVRERPLTLLTWEDAKAQAERWEGLADTIGGRARIVDFFTNEATYLFPIA